MTNQTRYDGFPILSPNMKNIFQQVKDYAKQGYPVVLFGPSGSGKEYLANYYFENYISCFKEAGRYESFNCANLLDTTSVVELFGSVEGIATDAKDRPGILEELGLGVLFLDEVGDLSPNVQAMLLRALHTNPKLREGRRLGAKKSYKIDPRLCIVCATEKEKENIRESLLYRMGAMINVPGLNERPEDVESALPWLFEKSIHTIRQKDSFLKTLDQNLQNEDIKDWRSFSESIARHLLPLVLSRVWTGNFRAINSVVTQSVIRSANSLNYSQLFDNVLLHFKEILPNYSKPGNNVSIPVYDQLRPDTKRQEEMNVKLKQVIEIFPRIKRDESEKIAEFLVSYSSLSFKRSDFEIFIDKKYTGRTAQKRLRDLVANNILEIEDKGIYRIKTKTFEGEMSKPAGIFASPQRKCDNEYLMQKADKLFPLIRDSKGIYISNPGELNTEGLVSCIANILKDKYPVYYFTFKNQDVFSLINAVQDEILKQKSLPELEETFNKSEVAALIPLLSGYFEQIVKTVLNPVFILDDVNKLMPTKQKKVLISIIKYWSFFRFVLIGDKMGNEFETFTEFKLY